MDVEPEKNKKKTGLRWRAREPRKLKYVEDGMIVSRINMDSGEMVGWDGRREVRRKMDIQTQNMFRRVVRRAESRGMVVNNGKTKVLCISDAMSYTAEGGFRDAEGSLLTSGGA